MATSKSRKSAPQPDAPAPQSAAPAEKGASLRKKDLIERVAQVSGAKKKDVKAAVEATLQVLGEALARGEALALPPLGKARVSRQKEAGAGEMLVIKLRRGAGAGGAAKAAKEGLADPEE